MSFRAPLTEDISTVIYTRQHADVESDDDEEPSLLASEGDADGKHRHPSALKTQAVKSLGNDDMDAPEDDDSDKCPATPVAGRRKTDREWRWTLASPPSDAQEERSPRNGIEMRQGSS